MIKMFIYIKSKLHCIRDKGIMKFLTIPLHTPPMSSNKKNQNKTIDKVVFISSVLNRGAFLHYQILFYRYAGLYCVVLTGYAKGKDFKPGDSFKGESNHSWNAVYIDDNWHLVDSKWAAMARNNNNITVSVIYTIILLLLKGARA